jgi:hypothetical protein
MAADALRDILVEQASGEHRYGRLFA